MRDCTTASYCSNSGRREARFGERSSASSVSRGEASGGERGRRRGVDRGRGPLRAQVVQRAVVHQRAHRHVSDEPLAVEHPHPARVRDRSDRGAADLPLLAQLQHRRHVRGRDHAQHPLLGLGDHDLERLHPRLAQGDAGEVDVEPHLPLGGHLRRRGGQPRGAEVLQRDQQTPLQQLQRALQELLLLERVAHLHGGAPVVVPLAVLGGGEHGRPPDPVAPGGGAEQHDHVAHAGRGGAHEPLARAEAERHRVDQTALLVGPLEVDLAADGGHADRVAVVPDAAHGPVEQVARAGGPRLR